MVRFAAYRPTRRRLTRPRPMMAAPVEQASSIGKWFRRSLLLAPGLGPILFVAIGWATWFRGPAVETNPVAEPSEVARIETQGDAPSNAEAP